MEMQRDAVAWIEIPVNDFDRAREFYSTIFAFEMPTMDMGPVRMGILLYDNLAGGIGGAIVKGEQGYVPSRTGSKVYLNASPDLQEVLDRVEGAGGRVVSPKFEVAPGLGHVASFLDSEGNEIYLHSTH